MDQAFIYKVTQTILKHIEDENFSVDHLASEIGFSKSQLLRKIKASTGKTVSEFIRDIRLQEAAILIKKDNLTASEISYRVGFSSPAYFNKCFHDYFGVTPGEYKSKNEDTPNIDYTIPKTSKSTPIKKRRNLLIGVLIIGLIAFISFIFVLYIYKKEENKTYSIAVLPIKNLSDDKSNQYFADGVMDDILNHISTFREFSVISRTTMEHYRETNKTIPEIAKELKVNYILESSFQKYQDSIKIITELIDAKKDKNIWAKKFGREFKNIFALESEIAQQIVSELEITLGSKEIEQIETKPTENLEAYKLYLKGRFFWNQKTKKDLERSIFYFNQALQLDSTYALAYSGLADTYLHMAGWGWYNRMEGLVKAKKFPTKALSINNNIAEAHATIGALLSYGQWKWDAGEREFKHAISLNPNYASVHEYYSMLLYAMCRLTEARKEIDIALQLNPYSVTVNQLSAACYFRSGDYEKALQKNQEIQKNFKNHPLVPKTNFRIYVMQKKYVKAVEEIKRMLSLSPSTKKYVDTVQQIYENSGIEGVYRWLIQYDIKIKVDIYHIAEKYAFLGENDKALALLEKCYKRRSVWAPYMKGNPFFKNLKSEPRFQAILKKMDMADLSDT